MLLDELVRAGVRHVVVAPGSRSTPLVLAAAARAELRVSVQIDERSAGFLALGIGKATGVPAAVITTSGTAVANLLPAVVEACQSESPLLLLTADRPPRLRGADANQAIDQAHIFGRYVRHFRELSPAEVSGAALAHLRSSAVRAVAAAVGEPAGAVHLNLPFEKPLEPTPVEGDLPDGLAEADPIAVGGRPDGAPFVRIARRRGVPDPDAVAALAGRVRGAGRPLVVAGPVPRPDEAGPALRRLAAAGIPVLADPLSGARFGPGVDAEGVVGGYDLVLRSGGARRALRPDLIVRFGQTPVSPGLLALLRECAAVPQVVVDAGARWKDHLAVASEAIGWDVALAADALAAAVGGAGAAGSDPDWTGAWRRAEAAARDASGVASPPLCEGAIAAEVAARTPGDALLFVSSSMPVRDLDAFGAARFDGPLVFGNRGASGIDGIVSSAIGASLGGGRTVVALLGDLALLHDVNGLLSARDDGVRVVFVVVHNDGGGIFHSLPVRRHEPEFTRLFATPHGREVARIAALHDVAHLRVETRDGAGETDGGLRGVDGLRDALDRALAMEGTVLVEVRTDRDENQRRHDEMTERVKAALDAAWTRGSR